MIGAAVEHVDDGIDGEPVGARDDGCDGDLRYRDLGRDLAGRDARAQLRRR